VSRAGRRTCELQDQAVRSIIATRSREFTLSKTETAAGRTAGAEDIATALLPRSTVDDIGL
jgi:hypothetical protein